MASHTIAGQQWPEGTVVTVHPAAAWPGPPQAPSGVPIDTGTVSGGSVTFEGLDTNVPYVAYGDPRGVRFLVASASAPAGDNAAAVGGYVSFDLIEDPVLGWPDRPDGAQSGTWIGWTDPTALMAEYDRFIPVPNPEA